jgi:hypothetical protein
MIKEYKKMFSRKRGGKTEFKIEVNFISLSDCEREKRSKNFWEIMYGSISNENRKA